MAESEIAQIRVRYAVLSKEQHHAPHRRPQLRQAIPYDSASVQRLQDEYLEIVACQGFQEPDKVVGLVFLVDSKSPNYQVITTKAPLTIEDVVQDYPHFKDEADSYESGRLRSWLGVPLIVKGEVIGMIAVNRQELWPFTAEETQLAMALANQAAMAIENARLYQEAKHLAITDGLTGLYNRRHFYELLEREVESVNRYFVIFLPHTGKKQAVALAERIRTSIEGHSFPGEEGFSSKVTISLGVATCPEHAAESETVVTAADMALLEAKKQRNAVCVCGEMV